MPEIRLIASDMDGTLFNSRREISDRNVKAILAAQQKGVLFALCTGRMPQFGSLHVNRRGISCPVIGANGGAVWDDATRSIISLHPIPAETLRQVHELLRRHGVTNYVFVPRGIISSDASVIHPNARVYDGALVHEYGMTFVGGKEEMEEAVFRDRIIKFYIPRHSDEICEKLARGFSEIEGIYVTTSGKNCFEIMSEGVNKCSGVSELAAMYGISMENVMTLGDYDNDMPMVQAAGLGVAMGNALEELKAVADYVTDTNDQDGVAKAIEKFVL